MLLSDLFKNIKDLSFYPMEDLSSFSTLKLQAKGDLLIIRSLNALQEVVTILKNKKKGYIILGMGANIILPANVEKVCLKLDFSYDKEIFSEPREYYRLPASITLNTLTAHAIRFSLSGWDVFTGIPATLGGAVFMNAGTSLGEIGSLVQEMVILNKDGELRSVKGEELSFGYRKNYALKEGDIILEVVLTHFGVSAEISGRIKEYLRKRSQSQPLDKRTCGCVFENIVTTDAVCHAGKSLDIIGLKELSLGALRVSPVHANFIENRGSATSDELNELITVLQREVLHCFGTTLETEVKRL